LAFLKLGHFSSPPWLRGSSRRPRNQKPGTVARPGSAQFSKIVFSTRFPFQRPEAAGCIILPFGHLDVQRGKMWGPRHLFQDVYPWAAKIRAVRISKNGNAFSYPAHIDREMRRLLPN
jgi:hypothetical protein